MTRIAFALGVSVWLALLALDTWVRPAAGLAVRYTRDGASGPAEFVSDPFGREPDGSGSAPAIGIHYEGWIRVRHAGVYHVGLRAPDGSSVRLDVDRAAFAGVNAGAAYPVQAFREFRPGLHAFELWYQRAAPSAPLGPPGLQVLWSKGVAVELALDPDALYGPRAAEWQFELSNGLRVLLGAGVLALLLLAVAVFASPARARALGQRFAALTIGTALAIGGAELGLRTAGVAPREYVPGTIWLTYAYPEPGSTTEYVGYLPYLPKEFEVPVHVNERGWRDRIYDYAKPPGVYRIVVVGDSYVEGKEVRLEDTFHKRLEARLNAELDGVGRRFEVIALARGGIGTEMESRVIRERARLYSPDLIVLAFYPGNDVRENHAGLDRAYQRWLSDVYGAKVVPARIACTDALTFSNASLLNNLVTARLCDLYVSQLDHLRDDISAAEMMSPDSGVYRAEYDADWRAAWQRTEQLIVESRRAATQMGAAFLLVLVHSAQLTGAEGAALAGAGGFDPDRPLGRAREMCERAKIDCLDLRPELERFRSETGRSFHWRYDAHWNEEGHRVAADALFERIAPGIHPVGSEFHAESGRDPLVEIRRDESE